MKLRVLSALLPAALVLLTATVLPASSAHASSLGGIDVVPAKGNAETLVSIVTERGCVTPAKRVSAVMYGKGLPPKGQVVVAPSEYLFSTTQPMELPLSNAFVIYAQRNSTGLQGTYTLKVRCTDRIGVTVLDEFSTTMSWKTPGGSLKNIEKATFTAKSTAGVLRKLPTASATPKPSSSTGTQPTPKASDPDAGSTAGGVVPDKEEPDGSNPGVEALVDPSAATTNDTPERTGWIVVGASVLALLAAAGIWFGGRRASS